jgi:hypothetical protein
MALAQGQAKAAEIALRVPARARVPEPEQVWAVERVRGALLRDL